MRPVYTLASPGTRIVFLFLFLLAGLFIAGLFLVLLSFIPAFAGDERASIYIGTLLQSAVAFVLPAYLVARMGGIDPWGYMKLEKEPGTGRKMAFGIAAFVLSYACVSFLNQWNQSIVLPESLRAVEEWMRSLEDSALETTHLLLSGGSSLYFILNLLIIAAVAALSEEIFFRGMLQQLLQEKYRNGHAAAWVTALIFSVIHFQFYGFFPRLILGALLGYLFLYTRNLWVPILVHFINNATVVVLSHFWGESEWMLSLEEAEITVPYATVAVLSAILTLSLFRKYRKKTRPISDRTETLAH